MRHGLLHDCADCAAVRAAVRVAAAATMQRNAALLTEAVEGALPERALAENRLLAEGCRFLDCVDAPAEAATRIIAEGAVETGIPTGRMVGPSRKRPVVRARDLAIWRIRQETALSLPRLGALFGERDHTTILAALVRERRRRA